MPAPERVGSDTITDARLLVFNCRHVAEFHITSGYQLIAIEIVFQVRDFSCHATQRHSGWTRPHSPAMTLCGWHLQSGSLVPSINALADACVHVNAADMRPKTCSQFSYETRSTVSGLCEEMGRFETALNQTVRVLPTARRTSQDTSLRPLLDVCHSTNPHWTKHFQARMICCLKLVAFQASQIKCSMWLTWMHL